MKLFSCSLENCSQFEVKMSPRNYGTFNDTEVNFSIKVWRFLVIAWVSKGDEFFCVAISFEKCWWESEKLNKTNWERGSVNTCIWHGWNADCARQSIWKKSTNVSDDFLGWSGGGPEKRSSEFREQRGRWRFARGVIGIFFLWRHCASLSIVM